MLPPPRMFAGLWAIWKERTVAGRNKAYSAEDEMVVVRFRL